MRRGRLAAAFPVLGLIALAGFLAFRPGPVAHGGQGFPAGPCTDDSFEDNDTQQTASSMSLPVNQPGLTSCPNDHDYFSFPLNAGDQVQVDVQFGHAFGDIDIWLFDQPGNVVAISETQSDNEKITYLASASGPHAVRVFLFGSPPATGNTYTLQITSTVPSPPTALLGDVNCDGVVNSIDAALVLQFTAGLIPGLLCQGPADVNYDGTVNSIDAALILQYDAGLISNLPPP